MNKSIFEKIIDREIPAEIILENDDVIVIEDNKPQAPVHLLIITKQKFENIESITAEIFISVQKAIIEAAKSKGIYDSGYRIVSNVRTDGGQSVYHLHFHLMGGHRLSAQIG